MMYFNGFVHLFENHNVINTAKVGSRFFRKLSTFSKNAPSSIEITIDSAHPTINSFKFGYLDYFVTCFDEAYKETNFNDFFYNNKKELIFVIRNPEERFFSGIVQIFSYLINNLYEEEEFRNEFKYFTNHTDRELKDLVKILRNNLSANNNEYLNLSKEIINSLIGYLIKRRMDFITGDSHTANYLYCYKQIIDNIQDKNKIKIIDLSQIPTKKGEKFIRGLVGDVISSTDLEKIYEHKVSNNAVYNSFIESSIHINNKGIIDKYLSVEKDIYYQLINSPYFVNLSD